MFIVVVCSLLLHMLAWLRMNFLNKLLRSSRRAHRHSAGPSTFAEVTAVTKLTKRTLKKKEEYIRSNSLGANYILRRRVAATRLASPREEFSRGALVSRIRS